MKQKLRNCLSMAISSTHVVLITSLSALLLASLGSSNPLSKSIDRWKVPISESELNALEELACIEEFLDVVPDNSKINLRSNAGPVWDQRINEILFPRVTIVDEKSQSTIFLDSVPTLDSPTQCSSVFLGATLND
jgi:hypothetical protein